MQEISLREEENSVFSDLHKDCYHYRPSSSHPFFNADDELRAKMFDALKENFYSLFHAKHAISEHAIEQALSCGAPDRETAMRWVRESFDEESYDD